MNRSTPLRRRTRLKNRGRSRFPKRRDPDFMRWYRRMCLLRVFSCIICGRPAIPAHIKTQGSGGCDRCNVVDLCWLHHTEQEGRTAEFEAKYRIDLHARADEIDEMYERRAA